jgi:hypothetical protein
MDLSAKCASRPSLRRPIFYAAVLSIVAAQPSGAQVSGTISGVVVDSSGGAVAGASVTVKSLETDAVHTTTTEETGRYQVFSLPVGQYEIRVTKEGFAEQIRTGIRLVVEQEASVDIPLRVGEVSQRIEVNADAPLVSVTTKDTSGMVGEHK